MKSKSLDKDWFDEKVDQVEPGAITAFGIQCSSRYGKARELSDMIKFCEQCALKGINKYINSLFYDSKSCCCNIDYDKDKIIKNHVHGTLRAIADSTLWQHDMDDRIGGYCNDEELDSMKATERSVIIEEATDQEVADSSDAKFCPFTPDNKCKKSDCMMFVVISVRDAEDLESYYQSSGYGRCGLINISAQSRMFVDDNEKEYFISKIEPDGGTRL